MNKNRIVVHCSATPPDMNIGAKTIDEWHRAKGWSAIGYAYVIRRSGTLELGRDLDDDGDVLEETGAHASGYNRSSIGICLVGGVRHFYPHRGQTAPAVIVQPSPNFTENQLTSLNSLISTLLVLFPDAVVLGHRDLPDVTKACPSFDVRRWRGTGEVVV